MQLLSPVNWPEYQLIDSGNFEKLERFGKYTLIRPEPQAVWPKSKSEADWESCCNARFLFEKKNPEKGRWLLKSGMPEQWVIPFTAGELKFRMRLGLTAFRHIGIFPEQAPNWDYIFNAVKTLKAVKARVLNLFAYTGGASLAACSAGAEVVHVDSVKPVITWAKENMEASGLQGIRWVVEDALKFVQREVRRGSVYQGIILDPPAYGRGAEGEKWVLEENILEMSMLCNKLLDPEHGFLLFNLYSMGFSALIIENLVNSVFLVLRESDCGELYVTDNSNRRLPLGIFFRGKY